MGTGFTVDTPLKVARYGISSVVSLVDDVLVEQMRRFHSERLGEPFEGISAKAEDSRARRMTAYLDLLDKLVARQVETLRATPFEPGSEITRYYELLPESPLKQDYRQMLETADPTAKTRLRAQLRRSAVPGTIDVNIMTKLDREHYRGGNEPIPEHSDALTALRGYARSTLRSSIVFSAGLNPRLYTYAAGFEDFFPDASGESRKRIIIKVSDFRSALIQGKFLASRGLWVSEFRVESGLNCGGHAFASQGYLLGPVLEEFRRCRQDLSDQMHPLYAKALEDLGRQPPERPQPVRVTVQGGIGTFEEDQLLQTRYEVDGTGWGTPFLLVPEVTNVDDEHLAKLLAAGDEDVYLSDSSPFGIPFWNLRHSGSENARRARIATGRPGSTCTRGYLRVYNTEFTERPICTASRAYQGLKLASLDREDLTPRQREAITASVLAKSCICHDLAGSATRKLGIDPEATPAICCGPNIVNFSKLATLDEMVGHIYGRLSLLTNPQRPHMFVRELMLYVDYLAREFENCSQGLEKRAAKYFTQFRENLLSGIEHYRELAGRLVEGQRADFLSALQTLQDVIKGMSLELMPAIQS
jgi:hypothetical protein